MHRFKLIELYFFEGVHDIKCTPIWLYKASKIGKGYFMEGYIMRLEFQVTRLEAVGLFLFALLALAVSYLGELIAAVEYYGG